MKRILLILITLLSLSLFSQVNYEIKRYKSEIDSMYISYYKDTIINNKTTTFIINDTISIVPLMITIDDDKIYLDNIKTSVVFYIISRESENNTHTLYKLRDSNGIRCNITISEGEEFYYRIDYSDLFYYVYIKKMD